MSGEIDHIIIVIVTTATTVVGSVRHGIICGYCLPMPLAARRLATSCRLQFIGLHCYHSSSHSLSSFTIIITFIIILITFIITLTTIYPPPPLNPIRVSSAYQCPSLREELYLAKSLAKIETFVKKVAIRLINYLFIQLNLFDQNLTTMFSTNPSHHLS